MKTFAGLEVRPATTQTFIRSERHISASLEVFLTFYIDVTAKFLLAHVDHHPTHPDTAPDGFVGRIRIFLCHFFSPYLNVLTLTKKILVRSHSR
jgi:hypothetical protein